MVSVYVSVCKCVFVWFHFLQGHLRALGLGQEAKAVALAIRDTDSGSRRKGEQVLPVFPPRRAEVPPGGRGRIGTERSEPQAGQAAAEGPETVVGGKSGAGNEAAQNGGAVSWVLSR